MIPYPIIRRLSAWTSASVHRPQPVSVGTEGKGTFRLGRGCLGWAYGDRPPDFYLLQCADHGVEPAGLDLRQTRDGGNLPRGHVSDTYPLRDLLPPAARRIRQCAVGNHLRWLLADPQFKFFHALMVHQKSFDATGKKACKETLKVYLGTQPEALQP